MNAGDILKVDGDTTTKVGSTLIGGIDNFKHHLTQYRHLSQQQYAVRQEIEKILPDESVLEYWNLLTHGDEKEHYLEPYKLQFASNPYVSITLDLTVDDPTGIPCYLERTWHDNDKETTEFVIPFDWINHRELVEQNLINAHARAKQTEAKAKLEERRTELLKKRQAIDTELNTLDS